ncbi:TPA: carbohydrate kinase, partial [Neisseria meningitidis]
ETFACVLGTLVASEHGATPDISAERIGRFMSPV